MFASWMHYQAYLLEGLTRTGHWQQGSSPRSNPTGLVIYAWLILRVYVAHRTLILYMSIYSSIAWVGRESAVPEEHPSIAEGKEEEGRNDQDSPMMRGSPSLLSLLLSFFPLILLLRRRRTIYEQEVEVCVVCASICGEHCWYISWPPLAPPYAIPGLSTCPEGYQEGQASGHLPAEFMLLALVVDGWSWVNWRLYINHYDCTCKAFIS